jgi:hypothetical protein
MITTGDNPKSDYQNTENDRCDPHMKTLIHGISPFLVRFFHYPKPLPSDSELILFQEFFHKIKRQRASSEADFLKNTNISDFRFRICDSYSRFLNVTLIQKSEIRIQKLKLNHP